MGYIRFPFWWYLLWRGRSSLKPDRLPAAPGILTLKRAIPSLGVMTPTGVVMARYDIQSLGALVGIYHRQFDDLPAWLSPQIDLAAGQYGWCIP